MSRQASFTMPETSPAQAENPCHENLHPLPNLPITSIGLGFIACLLSLSPMAMSWLQYESIEFLSQPWRILSCHSAHWSANHLFWSAGIFIVLGAACEMRDAKRFLACLATAAVVIPIALPLMHPEFHTYRGLSGIDSAFFTLLAALLLRSAARERNGWQLAGVALALIGFLGKIVFEMLTQRAIFVATGAATFLPVPAAHLVGALVRAYSDIGGMRRRLPPTGNTRAPNCRTLRNSPNQPLEYRPSWQELERWKARRQDCWLPPHRRDCCCRRCRCAGESWFAFFGSETASLGRWLRRSFFGC